MYIIVQPKGTQEYISRVSDNTLQKPTTMHIKLKRKTLKLPNRQKANFFSFLYIFKQKIYAPHFLFAR